MTVVLGLALPAGDHRHLPGRLPRQGRRLAGQGRRQGRRLQPDRPGIQGPGLLPLAPLGDRILRQRHLLRQRRPEQRRSARRGRAKTSRPTSARAPYDPNARRRPKSSLDQRHRQAVPVDAVTQSASGVDPHISQANARIQAHRIAAVRQLPLAQVEDLISAHTDGRSSALLGEPGVNVLELNIALDSRRRRLRVTMTTETQARSLFDPEILRPALWESVRKLDPRVQVRNPVMFVVEIGAVDHHRRLADPALRRRPARRRPRARLVHLQRHRLALAHGRLRQPRRGAGRGPRPRPGGEPAGDAHRGDGEDARRRREVRPPSWSAATSSWSRRGRGSPATAP